MPGPLNEVWKMSPSTNSPGPYGSARDLPSVAETVESTVSCHESCSPTVSSGRVRPAWDVLAMKARHGSAAS